MPIFKTNFAYSIFYFSAKIHLFFFIIIKISSEKIHTEKKKTYPKCEAWLTDVVHDRKNKMFLSLSTF